MGTPGACWCNTAFICPVNGPSNPKSVKRTIISSSFLEIRLLGRTFGNAGRHAFGLANEERRAADQRAIVNLSHEEVRDVSTTDKAEPPIL
jgi:hypothetical protein